MLQGDRTIGRIVTAWENKVGLLDADTGLMLNVYTLPPAPTPLTELS